MITPVQPKKVTTKIIALTNNSWPISVITTHQGRTVTIIVTKFTILVSWVLNQKRVHIISNFNVPCWEQKKITTQLKLVNKLTNLNVTGVNPNKLTYSWNSWVCDIPRGNWNLSQVYGDKLKTYINYLTIVTFFLYREFYLNYFFLVGGLVFGLLVRVLAGGNKCEIFL